MEKIKNSKALELSNLFFFIPLIVSLRYNLYWYAFVLFLVFVISFKFHFSEEFEDLYYLDVLFSVFLMFFNVILLFMGHWTLPYSAFAVICAIIAISFYFQRLENDYGFNHSMWHIFSAGVCTFCLLTFILS